MSFRCLQSCRINKYSPLLCQLRVMSQYIPSWLEATIDRDELSKPLPQDDLRRFRNIRATKTSDTFSVFYDPLVEAFVNQIMRNGQKKLARDLLNKTFENIKRIQVGKYNRTQCPEERSKMECNPFTITRQAVENCKPVLTMIKVAKGGVLYQFCGLCMYAHAQVPVACTPRRQQFMAFKWLIGSCRDKERILPFHTKMAKELMDAYRNEGKSMKKKHDLHRFCEANKAYAHLRP